MEGVWDWRHTEDGSFQKMCLPCSFGEGGPGVYMNLGGGGSSGPVGTWGEQLCKGKPWVHSYTGLK